MNGPVFVNLPNSVSVHISNLVWPNEERSVRREYDDTDASTIDITPRSHTVRDNFGREVVRGPTRCLFKEGNCTCQRSSDGQCEQTTSERAHPEHCGTVNHFGDAEVRNFEDRWIVFCWKQVLRNRIDVREVTGDDSNETAYLGCEIAMCDAMRVDVLQARCQSWKSPYSVEGGIDRTERAEHI